MIGSPGWLDGEAEPDARRALHHLLQRPAVPGGRAGDRALLRRLGHEVEFPAEQTCCGQMHFNSGYQDACIPLVERFVAPSTGTTRGDAVGFVRVDGPPISPVGRGARGGAGRGAGLAERWPRSRRVSSS